MAVVSGLPPLWGTLLAGEMGRETRECCLNDRVAVLRGFIIVIERAIKSLTPGGLVESRVLPDATNSSSWGMISSLSVTGDQYNWRARGISHPH